MTRTPLYNILASAVLFLTVVPVGIAVFILGFIYGDSPCVMCWEQRVGMALIALIGLFILRYGPRPRYIGLAVLVGCWGMYMALRHTGMHAARDIGQGFSLEILGAHTYTWALVIYAACVATMGGLLLAMKDGDAARDSREFRPLDSLAMGAFLIVIAANIVQAFASTGPPPFLGQGDPVRFSFNPHNWVWSAEEWNLNTPITWRGRWAVDKPTLAGLPADPAGGPLTGTTPLQTRRTLRVPAAVAQPATDLAFDGGSNRFLLTTADGLYVIDGTFERVLRHADIDRAYSVDLTPFVGAAFLDSNTMLAVSDNKSYVVVQDGKAVKADENFRFFTNGFDQFTHLARSRFGTVRARMMYVMAVAYDPASDSILTVSVPNAKNRRLVVSRFDRKDMTLSEEFLPQVATDTGLALTGKRGLDEYVVTGAAVADGILYALSAAHSTILSIDLGTHRVVAARTLAGLDHPSGLAITGTEFFIVNDKNQVTVAAR
jgi:disulfide bond formation protein DsbB